MGRQKKRNCLPVRRCWTTSKRRSFNQKRRNGRGWSASKAAEGARSGQIPGGIVALLCYVYILKSFWNLDYNQVQVVAMKQPPLLIMFSLVYYPICFSI